MGYGKGTRSGSVGVSEKIEEDEDPPRNKAEIWPRYSRDMAEI